MKKVLLIAALVLGSVLSTFAEVSLPYTISEQYALPNGCIMTLSGNGTITVDGNNIENHGSATISFSDGCGEVSGGSINITWMASGEDTAPKVNGQNEESKRYLLAHANVVQACQELIEKNTLHLRP